MMTMILIMMMSMTSRLNTSLKVSIRSLKVSISSVAEWLELAGFEIRRSRVQIPF